MTHQYNPQQYNPHQPPQPPPPQPQRPLKKGFSGLVVALALVGGLAVGCIGGVGISSAGSSGKPSATTANPPAAGSEPAPEQTTAEPAADYTPKPSDFSIKIKTVKQECFGSAGCNVTFRIDPTYNGPAFASDKSFTVSYKITGGEDPKISSFTVDGDQMHYDSEEMISTPSSSTVLKAKATQVL